MPTATSLIDDAGKELNILDAGETFSAAQYADMLVRLNALIDDWNTQELMATSATQTAVTTIANTQSYALGTRVIKVVSASHIIPSGPTLPIEIVDGTKWNKIPDRDISGNWVRFLFYDRGFATGTIYCSPKPLVSSGTIQIMVWTAQATFSTVSTNNALLPGWQRALTSALALEVAPMFSRQPDQILIAKAAEAMAELRRLNSELMGDLVATPLAAGQPAA